MKQEYVENIPLDMENELFFDTARLVLETEQLVIYLTGKAGTGKTTFLKYIRQIYKGNMVVLAPTGVAAVNANGQTIHSFFKLALTPYPPEDDRLNPNQINEHLKYTKGKREIIRNLELLVIDEISMVRCDILDAISKILCTYRHTPKPFGGVKTLLIGDTFQLPPIANENVWNILRDFYDSRFFFDSKAYKDSKPMYIELDKPYRQDEQAFIDLLNNLRINQLTAKDLEILGNRVLPFSASQGKDEESILLASRNDAVAFYNEQKFNEIKSEIYTFEGVVSGIFDEKQMPAEQLLQLKIGAQVIILRNKYNPTISDFDYCNGSIGIVKAIDIEKNMIIIRLSKKEVEVERAMWENVEYIWEKGKCIGNVIGTYVQYPLKLAWAITIHKSQGLSFERANIDLSHIFDSGQVYVALSRCKKLNGLQLSSPLSPHKIIVDPKVIDFAKNKTPHPKIVAFIEKGKADLLFKKSREAFEANSTDDMFTYFDEAIELRGDSDTPLIIKYLKHKIKLYHHYKKQQQKFFDQLKSEKKKSDMKDKDIQIEQLQSMIERLQSKIEELQKVNNESQNEISRLKSQTWWDKMIRKG